MAKFITEGQGVMEDALDAFRTKLRFQKMSFRFLRLVYYQKTDFKVSIWVGLIILGFHRTLTPVDKGRF